MWFVLWVGLSRFSVVLLNVQFGDKCVVLVLKALVCRWVRALAFFVDVSCDQSTFFGNSLLSFPVLVLLFPRCKCYNASV